MGAMPKESFDSPGRIFNGVVEDPRNPSETGDLVEQAAQLYREATANALKAYRRQSLLAEEADRMEQVEVQARGMQEASRKALIQAVIMADPRPIPGDDEWWRDDGPFWKAIVNGKLYALIRGDKGNSPEFEDAKDPAHLADLVSLAIIDLASIEVVSPASSTPMKGNGKPQLVVADPGDRPEPLSIREADERYLVSKRRWARASRAVDFHEKGAKEAESAMITGEKASDEAERDLIRAILAACPRDFPDDVEWYSSDRPLWTATDGGHLYALSRGRPGSSYPRDWNDVVKNVSLAIIDLDQIGGAS